TATPRSWRSATPYTQELGLDYTPSSHGKPSAFHFTSFH
ncbi:hypothetical protein CBR_g83113, partial [Chara braunii]